jgi:hypothetical protein
MTRTTLAAAALWLLAAAPVLAQDDAEGCKDHPLFTRFPNTSIYGCQTLQFDMRGFPVGAPDPAKDNMTRSVEVEGPLQWLQYVLKEGATPPSGLQIMRNFENAAKKAGGNPSDPSERGRFLVPGSSCLVRAWCLVRGAESRRPHPHVTPPAVTRQSGPAA